LFQVAFSKKRWLEVKQLWDERFRSEEYIYGKNPNRFFKQMIDRQKPGKILLPAEGEGRNAVYAASKVWNVSAFDISTEGQKKAFTLAKEMNVSISYELRSLEELEFKESSFDCIGLFYVHMSSDLRTLVHQQLLSFLKPGGTILLEAFSRNQLGNKSGGPKDPDRLFLETDLRSDFATLTKIDIQTKQIILDEGPFHQGEASVIQLSGVK
jgi:SAM-dependent methyltransferase